MEKLSLVIISFNEEKDIGRCIDSAKDIADEILVLDSNSTDRTVAIAESRGAIVRQACFQRIYPANQYGGRHGLP